MSISMARMITGPGTHDRSPPLRLLSSVNASSLVMSPPSHYRAGPLPSGFESYSPTSCRPRQPRPTWPRSHSLTVKTQPSTETSDLCALAHRDHGPMKTDYLVTTRSRAELGLRSYVDQLVCTSGGCSGRHGRVDVGTSTGEGTEEYDRPGIATIMYRTGVRKRGSTRGWKWAR